MARSLSFSLKPAHPGAEGNILGVFLSLYLRTGMQRMSVVHQPIRWILSAYLATLMPLCCCVVQVEAAGPSSSRTAHAGGYVHGGHDGGRHTHGQDPASGHDHSGQPGPGENHGSCDCGSLGPDGPAFTLQKAADLNWMGQAWHAPFTVVPRCLPQPVPCVRHKAPPSGTPRTLLSLHCALIV